MTIKFRIGVRLDEHHWWLIEETFKTGKDVLGWGLKIFN